MSRQSILLLMLPAFFECLVLLGLFSYLGIHVIKRKVIFVDLALAQIAALGSLIAFLFGISLHSPGGMVFSVALTAVAAAIFCLCRFRESKIPQEAIIGLVYAISAATAILLIDKAPHGAEHIKEILTGSILWVKWSTVGMTAAVYAVIGSFHYFFRRRFILISEDPERAWEEGISVRFWDFLFYLSFGIVITLSVSTAGVLLVFVFLVAPAIIGLMITHRWAAQLVIGWGLGLLVTTVGLLTSYFADLPTGPAVIGTYGVAMILIAAALHVVRAADRARALLNVSAVAGGFALVAAGFVAGGYALGGKGHAGHGRHHGEIPISRGEPADPDRQEKEKDEALIEVADLDALWERFKGLEDDQCKSDLVCRVLDLDGKEGAAMALEFLAGNPPLFFRQEIVDKLDEVLGEPSGFDASKDFDGPANRNAENKVKKRFGLEPAEKR